MGFVIMIDPHLFLVGNMKINLENIMMRSVFALFLTCFASFTTIQADSSLQTLPQDYQKKFLFPLTKNGDKNLTFEINVPSNFKFGYQTNDGRLFVEYIPANETIDQFSEIITLVQFPASRLTTVMPSMRDVIKAKANVTLAKLNFLEENGAKIATLFSEMPAEKIEQSGPKPLPNQREFLGIKAVQADNDVWMVQYMIRFNTLLNEEAKKQIIEKVKKFLEECKVVNLPDSKLVY